MDENEKKTARTALTFLSCTIVIAFIALIVWIGLRVLSLASAAIVPLLGGFFLALFFKPYYVWWKRLVKNPTLAVVIMLTTVFVPLGFFLSYMGAFIVDQLVNLIHQGPALVHQVQNWFGATFPNLKHLLDQTGVPYDSLGEFYTSAGGAAMKAGTTALKCLSAVITFLATLMFFVFFLMTRDRTGGEIVRSVPFFKDGTKEFLAVQIDAFVEILVGFFRRQTLICLIEGCLYGIGFACVGLPYGFLIGFALGVINLVPLLGSLVCLPVALPLAYFGAGGSVTRLCLVLLVWLSGQVLDGYFITPKIQGNKTGLGYMGVIFSFFFWGTVLGPVLGMLLAIPLSAFCVVFARALKCRYLRPIV